MAFDFTNAKKRGDFLKLNYDDVEKYCVDNGKVDWLISTCESLTVIKNGKPTVNFLLLKSRFLTEIMGIVAEKKEKPVSIYQRIAMLKEKK